jgi:hypothetical protein
MKVILSFTLLFIFCFSVNVSLAQEHFFPQLEINKVLSKAHYNASPHKPNKASNSNKTQDAFQCIKKMEQLKKTNWSKLIATDASRAIDTLYVGAGIDDTLIITGTYNHQGPIFVFNQGVLIIHNASVVNEGDIYVFGNGQLICDSSNLTFPQQYFYQRSFVAVQNALVYFKDVNFNYSGLQHNLVVGDSANMAMEHVHQNDWTTAGMYGGGSLYVDGMNLGGEYILTDSSTSVFKHVDTLLLWHKFPQNAVIDHSFPQGDTVYNYYFSNVIPNIAGVDYVNFTDSCHTVWWGIMPVNGSDVTLQNSNIRVAGPWFQYGDSLSVSGIENNTFYPNTLIPLVDRTLNMLNTYVQTWSFYVFDSSYVAIDNCTLGEVGTQQTANVVAQDILLDGSGGYFWATDTSFTYALNSTCYSTVRSERNGIFLLAYSDMPFAGPTATVSSLVISAQNTTAIDPIAYDGALAWNQKIESLNNVHVDAMVPIVGSAWIQQGPNGSWMDFQSHSLHYQIQGNSNWTAIVVDSALAVSDDTLAFWNTIGLQVGDYLLKQTVKNNLGDSIESFVSVQLLPSVVNIQDAYNIKSSSLFPNPTMNNSNLSFELLDAAVYKSYITDLTGKHVLDICSSQMFKPGKNNININVNGLSQGMYFLTLEGKAQSLRLKLLVGGK